MKYLKSKINSCLLLILISTTAVFAQPKKQKIDGVAAVVGDYVVLDSDIELTLMELKAKGMTSEDFTKCELLGKLLEDKLYAHHAIQDSLTVTDAEVNEHMDQQIEAMLEQVGNIDEIVKYYRKKDLADFREYYFEIVKNQKLTSKMQRKIVDAVEITPDEVRTFYNAIPKEDLPTIGAEVEIAQIVIKPVITDKAKQQVIQKLKEIKTDVLENDMSFSAKAALYSEDRGSAAAGGYYKINRRTQFVKEFKEVAFSLQEGEISEPFETDFGFHIIKIDKILGQEVELRHILMSPKVSDEDLAAAKIKIEDIRTKILNKEITFAEAAQKYSDHKETKNSGGIILNPRSFEPTFELTKMDPNLYSIVSDLNANDITKPMYENEAGVGESYKIITVNSKTEEHLADFSKDFIKIKEIALKDKQINEIAKWSKEKIEQTYIKINGEYRNCEFTNNWLKKEIK